MRLDIDLFTSALSELELSLLDEFPPANSEVIEWLIRENVDSEVILLMKEKWIGPAEVWAGPLYLYGDVRLQMIHARDPQALEHGLLILGSASNGDPLALDLVHEAGRMVYLSHDLFWNGKQPRDCCVKISDSIGRLLDRCIHNPDMVPIDYWSALRGL